MAESLMHTKTLIGRTLEELRSYIAEASQGPILKTGLPLESAEFE